jgi:hypothetical protein
LEIDQSGLQIVAGGVSSSGQDKVYLIRYINGEYKKTWESNSLGSPAMAVSIGDADNDGQKEIITVVNFKKATGPPRQRVSYQKILMFEDGSNGEPSFESQDFGWSQNGVRDSIIADADNDGFNEIVIVKNRSIEIYEWNGGGFSFLWRSPEYDYFIWNMDVGDADNDGQNEVIIALFNIGLAIVYEHVGGNTWGDAVATESIGSYNIDYAKVRDADNDGQNEIVGGGTSNKLNVWKYNNGAYWSAFLSEDLGGYTQGVDVGNLDHTTDDYNEVILGTAGAPDNRIYVYRLVLTDPDSYVFDWEMLDSISVMVVNEISAGDVDGDGNDEIVSWTDGISVYDFDDGFIILTYYFDEGARLEIG